MKHLEQLELFDRIKDEFWRRQMPMGVEVRVPLWRSLSVGTRIGKDYYTDPKQMPCKIRKDGKIRINGITITPKWHWTQDYYDHVKRQILAQFK